jgi:hypothetical protein
MMPAAASTRAAVSTGARFAALFAALFAAHQVADHWVQTEDQAAAKGLPGVEGWTANLGHVASYTATAAAAVAVTDRACGLGLSWRRVAAGLALSAVTHSWIDRRHTLKAAAALSGHADFYKLGAPREGKDDNPSLGTGAYAMDQSAHIGVLFFVALIAGGGRRR